MTDAEENAGTRGRAGASARAEYERRRTNDEARRRAVFGRWAPLVRLLAGPKASTEAWGRGADGEERVGDWLDDAVGRRGVVLHDRALPRWRSNLDHLAVVPSGIWVIDTKHYQGRLERRDVGGWFVSRPRLYVAGRDQSALVRSARRQQALVAEAVSASVPVSVALCFTGTEVALLTRPFGLEGVLITWPRALAKVLASPGALGPAERRGLADHLARAFPPYAPGGTSHKPTGASPRR
jgi:hypothetical protein